MSIWFIAVIGNVCIDRTNFTFYIGSIRLILVFAEFANLTIGSSCCEFISFWTIQALAF